MSSLRLGPSSGRRTESGLGCQRTDRTDTTIGKTSVQLMIIIRKTDPCGILSDRERSRYRSCRFLCRGYPPERNVRSDTIPISQNYKIKSSKSITNNNQHFPTIYNAWHTFCLIMLMRDTLFLESGFGRSLVGDQSLPIKFYVLCPMN